MKLFLAAGAAPALLIAGAALAGEPEDLPPNAAPGPCYQRITTPGATETYQERVVDVPEHTATRTVPPVYREVERSVMIQPGRVEHVHIPSTWHTETKTEVVRPESERTEVIPAQYDEVSEKVLVREAHTEWRRGEPGPVSDPDMPRNGSYLDVWCLIETPAEYRWETRRVLRAPEQVIRTMLPAEVRTHTFQVMDQPPLEQARETPPVYRVVPERELVQPERVETYTVPATYKMVTHTRVVGPGKTEWREYPCPNVVHHPRHPHPTPDTDGERGALDPALVPPDRAIHPLVLAQVLTAGEPALATR